MFKIHKDYTDYSGNEISKDFFFHLEQEEIAELHFKTDGGLERYMKGIMETRDGGVIIDFVKKIIDVSYGEKRLGSDSEMHFYKSPEILADFKSSKAYSLIYMQIATDGKLAAEFLRGLVEGSLDVSDEDFNQALAEAERITAIK